MGEAASHGCLELGDTLRGGRKAARHGQRREPTLRSCRTARATCCPSAPLPRIARRRRPAAGSQSELFIGLATAGSRAHLLQSAQVGPVLNTTRGCDAVGHEKNQAARAPERECLKLGKGRGGGAMRSIIG